METMILSAEQAADRLGLSTAQTRRCVQAFEKVHGPLGRDSRHHRVYTVAVVEKIETARQLVSEGGAANLEAALIAQRDGQLPVKLPGRGDVLAITLSDHGERLADHGERLAQIEGYLLKERDDLKRRNDYLLAELRRRDETQQPPRRWWFRG